MYARLKVFGTDQTVLRPIVLIVLRDIRKNLFGLKEGDDKVFYQIDAIHSAYKRRGQSHSNMLNPKDVQNYEEIINLESIEERIAEGYENTLLLLNPDNRAIIRDDEIELKATFVKQRMEVEMSVEYITTDKIYAKAIEDSLKLLAAYNNGTFGHNLEYHVPIPTYLRNLLLYSWQYKKDYHKDSAMSLMDYVANISDSRLTLLLPHDGKASGTTISYREKQMDCLGQVAADIEDLRIEEAEETNGVKIAFTYMFTYDRVIAINVDVPLQVYNRKLPNEFFRVVTNNEMPLHVSKQGVMSKFYNAFGYSPTEYKPMQSPTLVIPPHDRILPDNFPSSYARLLTQLIRVDPDDRRSLININKLNKVKFKSSIEKLIMGQERPYIGQYGKSLIWIALYEGDKILRKQTITIDEHGNMSIDYDMNMTKVYRIGVFLLLNFSLLIPTDFERLRYFLETDLNMNKEANKKRYNMMASNGADYVAERNGHIVNPSFIPSAYLSTLDILVRIYGLNKKEINEIIEDACGPVEGFFNIYYKKNLNKINYNIQLASINYCLDPVETKKKEEKEE